MTLTVSCLVLLVLSDGISRIMASGCVTGGLCLGVLADEDAACVVAGISGLVVGSDW